ncbi:MAG: tandem-95 repeat protein, partial [Chitinophagales bacterium]|nr:tandem-95 repeat protein [Chitinophagales bacterium]
MKNHLRNACIILLFLISPALNAQVLSTYSFTGSGACPNQNPDVVSQPANTVFSSFTSTNTTCVSTTDIFDNEGWNITGAIDLTQFNEFTITPDLYYALNLSSISFSHYTNENAAGNTMWVLRSSLDNFASDIATGITDTSIQTNTINLPAVSFSNIGAVTFRLYIVNANSVNTIWSNDDIIVNGTAEAIPPVNPGTPTSDSPQCSSPGVTLTSNGTPPASVTWYWQTSASGTSTSNSSSTLTVTTTGTYYIRAQNNTTLAWSLSADSIAVVITNDVSTPVFVSGASSTRCQGAATITYEAAAANTTGITYSLDATSSAFAGNSINSSTGEVTYAANWNGTTIITANAAGCNGPLTSTHTVTITPTVSAPVFTSGASSTRCQGTATITYEAAAANTTGITYSLDATTAAFAGNSINSTTGEVTYAANWNGTTTITAIAAGCNGPLTSTHTVTVTPTVSAPVFTSGASSTRCQGAVTITYGATAANTTGITYSLDATTAAFAGNSINSSTGEVTYAANWNGTTIITASAAGCNGPKTTTHTVTTTPSVGVPVFALGATSTLCQNPPNTFYTATATNSIGITYSLDAASSSAGNSINSSTGRVNYNSSWTGVAVITATATGCNGPQTAIHTVTVLSNVGTPVFTLGSTSTRCQGAATVNYTATAANNTGITYSLDATTDAFAGNSINTTTGDVTYAAAWSGTSVITVTATGCNGPRTATHTITTIPTVGNPVFALGATSTRCQGASTVSYTATATNNTGITYDLDATTAAFAGNSINTATGAVTYAAAWSGTSVITATATGCNGPRTATHTITTTPTVGTPVFAIGASTTRCQGAATVTYSATSTDNKGITYSLDVVTAAFAGNSINTTTGAVTYAATWSGTSVITASATGCNGPKSAIHTVTITPTVGTPVFALGASSARCQGAATIIYSATSTNNTGISYSIDATTAAFSGNSINTATGAVTYAATWSGTSIITVTTTGCNGPRTATHTVTTNLPVSTPVFALGATSSRCQASGSIAYIASAAHSTGITYSLDAATAAFAGNSINATTGAVTYAATWNGTSIITASASGCYGPLTSTHTVTTNPPVTAPLFDMGTSSTRCQGAGTMVYNATSTNETGITYSLDLISLFFGNTINSSTGAVTYTAGWNGSSTITARASGCSGPVSSTHTVNVTPTVGTPSFSAGSTSTRCQGAGSVTYTATSSNNTGISYSLDATSTAAGITINSATGAVTYLASWSGISVITATATGCNGPRITIHTVTSTPTVGTPAFTLGATSVRCQGSGTVSYSATASNTTGITYSLDATTDAFAGNSINTSTGAVTYASGWFGTSTITATAAGCNGPKTTTHAVTTNPTIGTPIFAAGSSSTRCQGIGTVTYTATASNATGITYSLDFASIDGGNSINTSTGEVTYDVDWNGTTVITAIASGCGGPKVSTHTVTVTPTVGIPIFSLGSSSTRCQGAGTVSYSAIASNTTGITYSLDATTDAFPGNSINASTGAVTYSSGWSGTSTITATAAGCNGPKTTIHTVTITPTVTAPVFTLGATSTRCQGAGTLSYSATATNSTVITYSIDVTSMSGGNTINSSTGALTFVAGWSGTTTVTARATGCNGPTNSTHTITITPTVGIPVFTLGATSTRCQGAANVLYSATSSNTTGITYILDAASIAAGNSINASNGQISYTSGWTGTSVITATSTGCNGPKSAIHTVTITPNGTISFALGDSSYRFQGAGNVTYTATANNGMPVVYSLDAASAAAGNTINSRGIVTYVYGWTGTAVVTATVSGCNGLQSKTHTVITETRIVTKQLYLSDPSQSLDRVDPVATNDNTLAQSVTLSSTGTTNTTFTQNPALCSPLIIKADTIKVQTYVSIVSGSMPVNPAITARLNYGATNVITLTNPTYNSTKQLLTWKGVLASDLIIPAGQTVSLNVTTAQAGVTFKIDYDNNLKPSEVSLLPVTTYIDITSFNLYSAQYPAGSVITGGIGSGVYYGRITVTDPFGTDDITAVSVLINPGNTTVSATPVATSGCTKIYEFPWNSPVSATAYKFVATAYEGYENTVTDKQDLIFDVCTACPPSAMNDSASGAGGSPLPIDVLANDSDPNGNLNRGSISIIKDPMNGSAFISNNQIIYLPNGSFSGKDTIVYQVCDSTSPTPLCATAFVYINIDPTVVDICSDAPKTHVYYMPYPEQDAYIALKASGSPAMPSNNIQTVISLTMPYPNMIIVWDEWEDGYESNYLSPAQSTTKIWGDGNPYNGIAPGYPNDIIPAGGGIVLTNTMNANPRNPSSFYYDGKDKVISTGQIAITQVCSEPSITSVQDIKTNVTSVFDFGQSFTIPVGQDFNSQDFAYTALFIRASEDNTIVNIDKDNNGFFETTVTLNEGNSYLVDGGVLVGATVVSDKPIGVELSSGGIDNYSIRNAPIYPATWYSNTYFTPVPTSDNPADNPKDTSAIMLYNSLNRPITINWYSGTPSSGTITLPSKEAVRFPLAYSTTAAYKFVNLTGESFTAIEMVDSYTPGGGGNSGSSYDWAFNLISEPRLTDFAITAWAPGGLDLSAPAGPDVNGNPIWVTPTSNTTVYVKYDGKVSGTTGSLSPCGMRYDRAYTLNALNYLKIRDSSDNDQSGIAIYTCDGVKLAAVYGEDPQGSTAGNSAFWDVGTTIQPFCRNKMIFANDDYAYTIINTPVTISILKNDAGFLAVVDPSTVTTAGFLQPKHGTVTINSNGTVLYTPNTGFAGIDTFEYRVCSTPSPVVCDIATVYVTVNACPAPATQNIISGMLFQDRNRDGLNNDGKTGFYPGKVYLYNDGNCNNAIDPNELADSVSVDSSGTYQFINYPEKSVADNFEDANGNNTCASGTDGNTAWLSNWTDIGNTTPATGLCVSRTLANSDVEIVRNGVNNFALRLKDVSKSATRTVNLSSATRAFLSFSYKRASSTLTAGEDIIVQASTNGSTFATIYTILGDGNTDANYVDVLNQDISAYTAATTYIRFLTNANVDEADSVFIDNVSIKYLKYPQCYIVKVDSASINSNYYLTTSSIKTFTAINAASCLSPYDFGVAKNIITLSGTIFNDLNGLKDSLVNGTATGAPAGATLFAYLAYPSGQIAYKTTVNAATGAYSFPLAEVNTDYVLVVSTVDSAATAKAPISAKLPLGWVSVGDAYGIINGAGSGIEAGIPNLSIPVKTAISSISNINFGIEQSPETAINIQANRGNPGGFTSINIPSSAFTTSNVGIHPNTLDYSGGTVTSILIPSFPTGVNSITIGGIVYTNGGTCPPSVTCSTWPVNGITLAAPGGVPSQTVSVDPVDGNTDVVIKTIAIDNAGVEDTTEGSITIPFKTITLSGLVWNDVDGNKNQEISEEAVNGANIGAGILTGNILYANLIDASGIVIASVQVQPDGTYGFPFVPQSATGLIIQLSINQGVVGLIKPLTALPAGWNNTGENKNGQGGGADVVNNGEIFLTTSTAAITAQNFGIEQTPQTAINLQPSTGNPGGFNTINIPASVFLNSNVGSNPNTEDYNGGFVSSIRITAFPADVNSIIINNVIYTNGGTCPPASTCVGWPVSGVTIPAPNGIISQTVLVDPLDGNTNVVIPIAAIDNAGLEDPTPGNITIPFKTISVSGTVWNDRNGNIIIDGSEASINGTNSGAGIKTGNTLYMNLIDATGNVIASVTVLANGAYSLPFVPQNSTGLILQLTSSQGTIGLTKPSTILSPGWINTGENKNGQGGIPDSRPNGEITLTTAAVNISSQNFGIEGKPIAVDDVNTTNEDTPVSSDVSVNDTPSGDGGNTWSLIGVNGGASNGTVTLNSTGTYTYTPNPNFNGIDTFTYSVCDVDNDCDTAIVVITVLGINDVPIAVNDINSTNEDTPVNGNASTNDTPSGDGGNIWTLISGASNGTVTMNPDGSYTYSPNPNFNGKDTFSYEVCDIDNDCSTAIVVITVNSVNDVPVARNDVNSTSEDTPVSGSVIGNDTLSGDGGNLWTLIGIDGGASNGVVTMNPDGSYIYTPNHDFNGVDVFTYKLCDIDNDCSIATVTIFIDSQDDVPVAINDSIVTNEDTPISSTVVINDTLSGDGGNIWTLIGVDGGASNGTVTMNPDGSYTYTPDPNFNGNDSFNYQICDADADCSTAIVYITIVPVDDFPIANADVNSTNEDSPITNATVVPNDVLS